jgi:hypothetical protein
MEIANTKHTYFNESSFPSLHALNPGPDSFPHLHLPDFSSLPSLPFNVDDELAQPPTCGQDKPVCESTTSSPPEGELGCKRAPSAHEDEVMNEGTSTNSSMSDDQQRPPSRQLVLRLCPHPTCIDSSFSLENVISHCTRAAAAFLVTSTEPASHAQAMDCNDWEQ